MCGIVGFQGAFGADLLDAMSEAVAHRGPDGKGHFFASGRRAQDTVGLAHRRLAIIDLSSAGCQPMGVRCSRCGGTGLDDLALSYNGEIYNYAELKRELESKGHQFRTDTDSEVLLHLYAEYGLEMLSRLNGIFAFAIYDGRERGRPEGVQRGDLFLARDPLGVKPLYVAETDQGFCFASELKALLRNPRLPRELDAAAVHFHLAYLWAPAPTTPLRAVRKMPPGTAVVVHGGKVARRWTYYDLPYGQPLATGSEREIAEQLFEHLAAAVSRQMVADVPVGAFLSGGLDSSTVVAMMRRARPGYRPVCYSIGFAEGEGVDGSAADLPYARRVAEHLDVDLRTIEVRPEMIRHLERMLYHLDEPQADPAPINALLIAEQARRDGIPVLLSGAGGDDIFSGYRRHRALQFERSWKWMPRSVRSGMAHASAAVAGSGLFGTRSPAARRLAKLFANAELNGDRALAAYFWWGGEQMRRSLYSKEFSDQLGEVDTAAPLLQSLQRIPAETDRLNRLLYLETKHFLADHNLNYTDKVGMAAGVEVRVPLLDLDLVNFAARIPPALKQRRGTGKYILKRAMERELPRDVVYRPKSGFGAPLRRWLQTELKDQVDETLSADTLRSRGLFDPAAVAELIRRDRVGSIDGTYTIFALMCFELWCQMFIDGKGSRYEYAL